MAHDDNEDSLSEKIVEISLSSNNLNYGELPKVVDFVMKTLARTRKQNGKDVYHSIVSQISQGAYFLIF